MPRSSLTKISTVISLACFLGAASLSQRVLAQPAPTIAPSPSPGADSINQQLLGQWKTKKSIGGDTLTLVFAPNGKAFLILSPATAKRTVGREIQYKTDLAPKPSHIDFILGELGTVETLFELDGKELRLQLLETSPGKPRPTAFREATVLEKVSDATTLPTGVELYDPKRGASRVKRSEASLYIGSMNRAQQAYYLENNKFVSNFKDFEFLGIKPETDNYRYQVVPQGDGTQQGMVTAQSKKPGLKSYTGAAFIVQNQQGEATMLTAICETAQASTTAPVMPKLVKAPNQDDRAECPAGSNLLE